MGKPTMSVAQRNAFARSHDRLVRKIAHRYSLQCAEPWEDLFQIGYLGLLKAVERFDPTRGNAFSSFAVPYIQGEIQHFLRARWGVIKVPRQELETVADVKRIKRKLEALGATVDEVSVARALQIEESVWAEMIQATNGNLVTPLSDTHYQIAVPPTDIRDEAPSVSRERLYEELYSLPPIQQAILQEAFFAGMSLTTIASRHGLTVAEVSKIVQQGLSNMTQKINLNTN